LVIASTLFDKAELARALAVATSTKPYWKKTPRRATGARRPDLLLFRRAGSWERVPLGGRVPPVARVGLPAKLRAPRVSAHARACTGCVSSRRSRARPRTGALAQRTSHDPVRFSVKDEATGVPRSGPELDLRLRRQCALDAETAQPASSKTRCVNGLKLVVT
jgi:hypothetical protein